MEVIWSEGPRTMGCLYHRVTRVAVSEGTVQIDVFVRPQDLQRRGIAITVKRFGDPATASHCDIHKTQYAERAAVKAEFAVRRLGGTFPASRSVGDGLRTLLDREKARIEAALAEAALKPSEDELPSPDNLWDDV